MDFDDIRLLIQLARLICDSCSSSQRFACGFLQIPPRDGHPCRPANDSPCRVRRRLSLPSVRPAGRTNQKATNMMFVAFLLDEREGYFISVFGTRFSCNGAVVLELLPVVFYESLLLAMTKSGVEVVLLHLS